MKGNTNSVNTGNIYLIGNIKINGEYDENGKWWHTNELTTEIDVTNIPNYSKLTKDNFIFKINNYICYYDLQDVTDTFFEDVVNSNFIPKINYNPSQGVISLTNIYDYIYRSINVGYAAYTGELYCYTGDIKKM